MLREEGIRLESLANIDRFEDGRPIFRDYITERGLWNADVRFDREEKAGTRLGQG